MMSKMSVFKEEMLILNTLHALLTLITKIKFEQKSSVRHQSHFHELLLQVLDFLK